MCFLLLSPRISHVPLCPAWEWLLFLLHFLLFSPSLCIRVCGVLAYMLCVPHIGVCIVCRGLRLTLGLFLNCSPHWFQRQKGKKKWQLLLLQIQVLSRIITNKISSWHLEAKTLHPVSQVRARRSFPAVNVLCNVILKIKSCIALHHTPGFPVFFFLRCEPLFPRTFPSCLAQQPSPIAALSREPPRKEDLKEHEWAAEGWLSEQRGLRPGQLPRDPGLEKCLGNPGRVVHKRQSSLKLRYSPGASPDARCVLVGLPTQTLPTPPPPLWAQQKTCLSKCSDKGFSYFHWPILTKLREVDSVL